MHGANLCWCWQRGFAVEGLIVEDLGAGVVDREGVSVEG